VPHPTVYGIRFNSYINKDYNTTLPLSTVLTATQGSLEAVSFRHIATFWLLDAEAREVAIKTVPM
jgi:hypothetical protein